MNRHSTRQTYQKLQKLTRLTPDAALTDGNPEENNLLASAELGVVGL